MNRKLQLRALVYVLSFLPALASAQDIHYTQFNNSPINLNPGLTGVFGGDGRLIVNYRSQWRSVPIPYTTFSGSAEAKFYPRKGDYSRFLTGGVSINNDEQGSLHLKSMSVGIPLGATLPLGKSHYFSFGVIPALGQRNFDTNKNIAFDSQWDGRMYNAARPTNEDAILAVTNLKYFDLSAGFNLRLQSPKARDRFDFGVAVHHINRPDHDFWSSKLVNSGNNRLYNKNTFYGIGLVQIDNNFDLLGSAMWQRQGAFRELVYGFGARFHLVTKQYQELALQVGVNRRHYFNDALVPHLEFLWRTLTVGFTYDINWQPTVEDINVAPPANAVITSGRGGPEVSVIYRFYKVKPLPRFKTCPVM